MKTVRDYETVDQLAPDNELGIETVDNNNVVPENSPLSEQAEMDLEVLTQRQAQIQENRETAREGQRDQANKMLQISAKKFAALEVGQNVRVFVADVDRAKCDARNILGIVTAKIDTFYKIGTKSGHLPQLFARNQLEPTSETFIEMSDVPDHAVNSVRSVATEASVSGGQGHIHCNCKSTCQDKRCKCRREGRICNSRCHNSSNCTNK